MDQERWDGDDEASRSPDCVMLFTHGVGNQIRWSDLEAFQGGLMAFLNARLRGQSRVTTRPAPAAASLERGFDVEMTRPASGRGEETTRRKVIRFREFHWADLDGPVRPSPARFLGQLGWLFKKLAKARFNRLRPLGTGWWTGFRLFVRLGFLFLALLAAGVVGFGLSSFNWLKCLLGGTGYGSSAKAAGALMEYIKDISVLDDKKIRGAINGRFNRTLTDIIAQDKPTSLVVVSHSLGSVFALDQIKRQLTGYGIPLGWVCLGSPLWALPLIDKDFNYRRDLDHHLELGWYNIYDFFDPVGGPIYHPNLTNPTEQWRKKYYNPISAHRRYLTTEEHVAKLWELATAWLAKPRVEETISAARSPFNRRPLRLGPFLRRSDDHSMTIWTAMVEPGRYRAELKGPDGFLASQEAELDNATDRTACWSFEGLEPGLEYCFRVSRLEERDGRILAWPLSRRNRPGQLMGERPTWFPFTTPNTTKLPQRLFFASCNHPFHVHWDGESGYYFISRLLEDMAANPERRPDAAFYIGDQIYADDWWHDELYLPWADKAARQAARLKVYGRVYDHYWQSHPWTDLMNKAPAYMIWDDHEIRDGWGCNVHDYDGDDRDFRTSATEKFQAATQAMEYYQTCGNPPPTSTRDFQFRVDIGPTSTFLFDNRMVRNYRRADAYHPYGADQIERFKAWAAEAGRTHEVLIVACSTPPVFFQPWRLNFVADKCPPVLRWMEKFMDFQAVDDDLRDQLPFRLNILTRDTILDELAKVLEAHPAGARRAVIVGGDVHVGGYVRIEIGNGKRIDQWISSPITNKPNKLMHVVARYAACSQTVGRKVGRKFKAHRFVFKPVRNVVLLSIGERPGPGQAPTVKGEFIWEKGYGIKSLERILE